jgi:hypothetical protein
VPEAPSTAAVAAPPPAIWRVHSAIEHFSVESLRSCLKECDAGQLNLCYDLESSTYSTIKAKTALGILLKAVVRKHHAVKPRSANISAVDEVKQATQKASSSGAQGEWSETEPLLDAAAAGNLEGEEKDLIAAEAICSMLLKAGADPLRPMQPPGCATSMPANFLQATTSRLFLPGELEGGDPVFIDELAGMFSRALKVVTPQAGVESGSGREDSSLRRLVVDTSTLVAWGLSGRTNAIGACLAYLKEHSGEALVKAVNSAYKIASFGTFNPLTAAVFSESFDAVRLFMTKGQADPDLQPRLALSDAYRLGSSRQGSTGTVDELDLSKAGQSTKQPSQPLTLSGPPADTALIMAIQQQNEDIVRYLLQGDTSQTTGGSAVGGDENPAAHYSATAVKAGAGSAESEAKGEVRSVPAPKKADPNLPRLDSIEATPLLVALGLPVPSAEVVEMLILAGADVNKPDKLGTTPLHAAVQSINAEIPELLIAAGATGEEGTKAAVPNEESGLARAGGER